MISGDKRRLARVVANLIDNARLYGGGEVTVEVTEAHGEPSRSATPGSRSRTTARACPLEERDRRLRAVRPRADRRAAQHERGAGLGLALVDEHVRMHGGRVWVEDRLDGEPGARFVIELPAEEVGA